MPDLTFVSTDDLIKEMDASEPTVTRKEVGPTVHLHFYYPTCGHEAGLLYVQPLNEAKAREGHRDCPTCKRIQAVADRIADEFGIEADEILNGLPMDMEE